MEQQLSLTILNTWNTGARTDDVVHICVDDKGNTYWVEPYSISDLTLTPEEESELLDSIKAIRQAQA